MGPVPPPVIVMVALPGLSDKSGLLSWLKMNRENSPSPLLTMGTVMQSGPGFWALNNKTPLVEVKSAGEAAISKA